MKYITIIITSLFFMTACQQQEDAKQAPAEVTQEAKSTPSNKANDTADAPATSETEEAHDHNHDHAAATPVMGERYQIVEPQAECDEPVVIEFFAYQCPHCYNLEPAAEAWREKNGGKVKFRSVPWDLGRKEMGSMVLVHHAAKLLGVLDKTIPALFKRFHEEKKLFTSPEEAVEFLVAQGADPVKAKQTLEDQEAMTKSIQADYKLLGDYKIASVPQVLINHRYLTSTTAAGSTQAVFEVVDETLAKEHSCTAK